MDSRLLLFWDYVSVSVVGLYAYPVLRLLATGSWSWIVMIFGLFLMHIVTTIIKRLVWEEDAIWTHRPLGAFNTDILCRNGSQEGRPGFPSGHMATVVFFMVMWWWIELRHTTCKQTRGLTILSMLVYTCLVALARHYKKCHTWLQIGIGSFIGFVSAMLLYIVIVDDR